MGQSQRRGRTEPVRGFLGLDNIGVVDRNRTLPDGVDLAQADATAWMGLSRVAMLRIVVELAQEWPVYRDIASKFLGRYTAIVEAIGAKRRPCCNCMPSIAGAWRKWTG